MKSEPFSSSIWFSYRCRTSTVVSHLHGVLPVGPPNSSWRLSKPYRIPIQDEGIFNQCPPAQTVNPNIVTCPKGSLDAAIFRMDLPVSIKGSHQQLPPQLFDSELWVCQIQENDPPFDAGPLCYINIPLRESHGHLPVSHLDARLGTQRGKHANY